MQAILDTCVLVRRAEQGGFSWTALSFHGILAVWRTVVFLALLPIVFGSLEASGTWSLATSKRGMRIRASGTGRDGDDRATDRGAYGNTAWRVAVWGEAMRNWVTPINPYLMSL